MATSYSSFPPANVSNEVFSGNYPGTAIGVEILTGTTSLIAPTNLSASANGTNIDLSWSDSNSDEDGFKIYRSSDGTNFDSLDTSTNTNYSDNVGYNQRYYYKVTAYKGVEESNPSSIVSDSTGSQSSGQVTKYFIQDSTSTAYTGSAESVWYFQQLPNIEDGQLTAYKVYFNTNETANVKFALFEGDSANKSITDLVPNTESIITTPQIGLIRIPVTNGPNLDATKEYYIGYCGDDYYHAPRTTGSGRFQLLYKSMATSYSSFPPANVSNEVFSGNYPGTAIGVEILTGTTSLIAPTITSHPQNQNVLEGSSVIFSVTADGSSPLSYQWKENGNNISGATSSTYAMLSVDTTMNGNTYSCTVSNTIESVTSTSATLTVTPDGGAYQILNFSVTDSGDKLIVSWDPYCVSNKKYNLYKKEEPNGQSELAISTTETSFTDPVGYNKTYTYTLEVVDDPIQDPTQSIPSPEGGCEYNNTTVTGSTGIDGDYYISCSTGNDDNNGTSEATPWKTLSKLESMLSSFTAGTNVLLKRGDIWNETLSFSNFNNGTELNPVVFGAYGNETDPKPLITQKDTLPDFTNPDRWDLDGNRWKYTFPQPLLSGVWVKRLWIDDQEYMFAHDGTTEHPDIGDSLAFDSKHRWKPIYEYDHMNKIDTPDSILFIWVPNVSDTPYVFYNKIEIAGTVAEVIYINNSANILLKELHIEGGSRRNVYIENGSKNITIENCEMYNSGEDIININGSNTEKIIIRNNILDTKLDKIFDAPIRYEIEDMVLVDIQWGADYCEIYGNTIKGGGISHVRVIGKDTYGAMIENKIYNNKIRSTNCWARAFTINYANAISDGISYVVNTEIYNNHIENMTVHSQFSGNNSKIYYNIWDSTAAYQNYYTLGHYQDIGDEDWGIVDKDYALTLSSEGDSPNDVKIFNNTIYYTGQASINCGTYNTKYVNNLFINSHEVFKSGGYYHGLMIDQDAERGNGKSIIGNYYYNADSSNENTVIRYGFPAGGNYSVYKTWTELEQDIIPNDTASGNVAADAFLPLEDPEGTKNNDEDDDFTLKIGSNAISAGSGVVAAWLPDGFADRYGNTVNQTSPNIGAVDNDNSLGKTTVEENNSNLPKEYSLLGNYPNPFNPSTKIKYAMPNNSNVGLVIYDMLGRTIRSFEINSQSAGFNEILWDGTNNNGNKVSSGIYIYRIKAVSLEGNGKVFEKSAKLMLLK